VLGLLAGIGAGLVWGAIPGALKAFRGAHEVISTIMLNFVALYFGEYLVAVSGPMQGGTPGIPSSETLPSSSWLPSFWSAGGLEAHSGLRIAILSVVLYWVILERTVLGYAVRAVGSNPEAARYGGISVHRSMIVSMAIAGAFAGLAGSVDLLGNSDHAIVQSNLQVVQLGFTGIAVALLGRNNGIGIVLAAFLFATLDSGSRAVTGGISPELARALAQVIQGTIILLVGGETIVAWLLRRRADEVAPLTLTPSTAVVEEASG
jgi:general nucleoside transport system permease protein